MIVWDVLQDGVYNLKESSDQPEWVGVVAFFFMVHDFVSALGDPL